MVKLQKESAAACVLCPLIANTQLLISYFKLNLYTISVKSYKGQLGSRFDSYMVMADLALLEDLANHAMRRERVFKKCTDLFSESREWFISLSLP